MFLILRSIGIYVLTAHRRTPTTIIRSKIDNSDIMIDFRSLIKQESEHIKRTIKNCVLICIKDRYQQDFKSYIIIV